MTKKDDKNKNTNELALNNTHAKDSVSNGKSTGNESQNNGKTTNENLSKKNDTKEIVQNPVSSKDSVNFANNSDKKIKVKKEKLSSIEIQKQSIVQDSIRIQILKNECLAENKETKKLDSVSIGGNDKILQNSKKQLSEISSDKIIIPTNLTPKEKDQFKERQKLMDAKVKNYKVLISQADSLNKLNIASDLVGSNRLSKEIQDVISSSKPDTLILNDNYFDYKNLFANKAQKNYIKNAYTLAIQQRNLKLQKHISELKSDSSQSSNPTLAYEIEKKIQVYKDVINKSEKANDLSVLKNDKKQINPDVYIENNVAVDSIGSIIRVLEKKVSALNGSMQQPNAQDIRNINMLKLLQSDLLNINSQSSILENIDGDRSKKVHTDSEKETLDKVDIENKLFQAIDLSYAVEDVKVIYTKTKLLELSNTSIHNLAQSIKLQSEIADKLQQAGIIYKQLSEERKAYNIGYAQNENKTTENQLVQNSNKTKLENPINKIDSGVGQVNKTVAIKSFSVQLGNLTNEQLKKIKLLTNIVFTEPGNEKVFFAGKSASYNEAKKLRVQLLNVVHDAFVTEFSGDSKVVKLSKQELLSQKQTDSIKLNKEVEKNLAILKNNKEKEVVSESNKQGSGKLAYKVQVAALSLVEANKLLQMDPLYSIEPIGGNLVRVLYGNYASYREVNEAKIKMRKSGYPDAFITAYSDEKRIAVKDAVVLEKQIVTQLAKNEVVSDSVSQSIVKVEPQTYILLLGVYNDTLPENVSKIILNHPNEKVYKFLDANNKLNICMGDYSNKAEIEKIRKSIEKEGLIKVATIEKSDYKKESERKPILTISEKDQLAINNIPKLKERYDFVKPTAKKADESNVAVVKNNETTSKTKTYTVIIGTFNKNISVEAANILIKYNTLGIQKYNVGNNVASYAIGNFSNIKDAEAFRKMLLKDGMIASQVQDLSLIKGEKLESNLASGSKENESLVHTDSKTALQNVIKANTNVQTQERLQFKVQIGAYKKDITISFFDKMLTVLSSGIEKQQNALGLYIYTTGNYSKYSEASALKYKIIAQGIPDAFIVSYFNGEKIPISKAIELQKP